MRIIRLLMVLYSLSLCLPLTAQETQYLKELVIIAGKQKHKKMLGTGIKIPCAVASLTPDKTGYEIGSIIKTKHPFEIKEISFRVSSNSIPGAVLGVEIYRIDSLFTKVLPAPIIVEVPVCRRQRVNVTPKEQTIIEPGEYFVAVRFADCDEKKEDGNIDSEKPKTLLFPLYIKDSFIRNSSNTALEKCKINLGLKIKGIEYR